MTENKEREMYSDNADQVVNAESLNFDSTLNDLSRELKPGETLVLDIGNNYFHQTDEIYDTLVMKGFDVRKSFKNGRNQIIVSKKL
jgi:6-phosphogluconate dehydrogenase (decarboxylating)